MSRVTSWSKSRHLAGRLDITRVDGIGRAAPHAAAANGFRRVLVRGGRGLPDDAAALLVGLTLGDDRGHSSALTADFRAAGLAHLVAVSGQNLVLVMALVGPLLRRVRIWPRLVLGGSVVVAFSFVTRFEPSVTRACAVALVAGWAGTLGRSSGGLRHLAVAVTGLVLVDPLLVHSVGFRLSAAASIGVLVLAPAVRNRVRGPGWFRDQVAVTVGAQLAVAPVLVPTFGPMPLVAVPANVVAAPFAAVLTGWGLVGGLVAGLVPANTAALVHLPTGLAAAGVAAVARVGAATPLGVFDLRHVAVVAVAVSLWWAGPRFAAPACRTVAVVLVAAAVVLAAVAPVTAGSAEVGWAATVWTDGSSAVVEVRPGVSAVDVLVDLRRRRVDAVALVVVRSVDPAVTDLVAALRSRFPVGAVLAPPRSGLSTVTVAPGQRIRVGRFAVEVVDTDPEFVVRIGR